MPEQKKQEANNVLDFEEGREKTKVAREKRKAAYRTELVRTTNKAILDCHRYFIDDLMFLHQKLVSIHNEKKHGGKFYEGVYNWKELVRQFIQTYLEWKGVFAKRSAALRREKIKNYVSDKTDSLNKIFNATSPDVWPVDNYEEFLNQFEIFMNKFENQ